MRVKYEKSAGWIVYRKNKNIIEILLLEWLNSKKEVIYVIPKWHIEAWEIAKQAALREISEEAWLYERDLEVIKFVTKLNYTFKAWYLENNPMIDKDVYLFLVKYNWNKKPYFEKKERFIWYKWFTIEQLKKEKLMFDLNAIVSRNIAYFI